MKFPYSRYTGRATAEPLMAARPLGTAQLQRGQSPHFSPFDGRPCFPSHPEGPFRDPTPSSPSSLFVFYFAHPRLRRKFSRSLALPRSLNSQRSLLSPTSSSSLSQIRCAIPSPSFQLSSTLPFHNDLQQVYFCPGLCRLGQPRLCWSDSRLSPVGHWVSSLCGYGVMAIIAVAPRLTFRSRS